MGPSGREIACYERGCGSPSQHQEDGRMKGDRRKGKSSCLEGNFPKKLTVSERQSTLSPQESETACMLSKIRSQGSMSSV